MSWREVVLLIAFLSASVWAVYERDSRNDVVLELVPSVKALCSDGTYSTSRRDNGTCSGHGGVDEWIVKE